VPLKAKKGAVLGVVQLINKNANDDAMTTPTLTAASGEPSCSFTASDLCFLEVIASQAATAIAADRPDQGTALEKPSERGLIIPPLSRDLKIPFDEKHPDAGSSCTNSIDKAMDVLMDLQVADLLTESLNSWDLDTLALAEVTGNRPLSTLGLFLFDKLGLTRHFGLDQEKLFKFLLEIEAGYDDANAYHNRCHAAAVMHAIYALLERGGIGTLCSSAHQDEGMALTGNDRPLILMACLLAAAVHDYEHRGLTNDFLVKTSDERALRYNDQHANENHHVAAAFALLHQRPDCDLLAKLPANEYRRLRSVMIDLVLATDMANHASLIHAFSEELDSAPASPGALSSKGAVLLLQISMKCSDLGHLALDWPLHMRWVKRLESEFFKQGDKEKQLGIPVSYLMDHEKPGVSKSQVGFFDAVVLPLFRVIDKAAPAASELLFRVIRNYQQWCDLEGISTTGTVGLTGEKMMAGAAATTTTFVPVAKAARHKKSGRARQRAAKWWAGVRQRTPSPGSPIR
jgi:cAMP-specific phosphodiesterase 4/high affinity cAMP-specific and IBMX-insensitive 3',5'-cyclic phosphodiesterase 8